MLLIQLILGIHIFAVGTPSATSFAAVYLWFNLESTGNK